MPQWRILEDALQAGVGLRVTMDVRVVDTDVLLDVALNREPFVRDAVEVIGRPRLNPGGWIAWHRWQSARLLLPAAFKFELRCPQGLI